jgi:hypothetical protein
MKFSELESCKQNPFMSNLLIPKRKRNVRIANSDKAILDKGTGEVESTLFLGQTKTIDKEQFVKIFHNSLQSLFDLSNVSIRVFAYIGSVTTFDDKIIFDVEECKSFTNLTSRTTIYKALTELIEAEFIAKSNLNNIFYINPQIFYKGDRIVLVNEYKVKRNKELLNLAQIKLFE